MYPETVYRRTPELQFAPTTLRLGPLQEYLKENRVSYRGCVEKQDLVDLAFRTHGQTKRVDKVLQEDRRCVEDAYQLLDDAYKVLSNDDTRRQYNLSGDWGVPGLAGRLVSPKITNAIMKAMEWGLGGDK